MSIVRVLQVFRILDRGGAETLMMNIYRNMDRTKVQFDFLVQHDKVGDYEEEIKNLGGRIYRIPYITKVGPFLYKRKLSTFFKEFSFPIVHSHMNEMSSIILGQAKKANVPVRIAHSHNYYPKYSFLEGLFRYYLKSGISNVVTFQFGCSQDSLKWLFGEINSNSQVLKNCVNLDVFKNGFRKYLSNERKVCLGHIGSFSKQKNHQFILEIFRRVLEINENSELVLVGDGPLKSQVEENAKRMGIYDKIRFLGVRSDIPQLLSGMDLFLLPSFYEGLPVTLVEAQAVGLNCLITDSITEEVDMGCGLIHRLSLKSSPEEWANKALSLCLTKTMVDSHPFIKERGYDTVETSKRLMEFYLTEYESILK